jgi:hypothetical protein
MLILNQHQLQTVLAEYVDHYNTHRPHRSLRQAAPLKPLPTAAADDNIRILRRDRLGGLIHEYSQAAWHDRSYRPPQADRHGRIPGPPTGDRPRSLGDQPPPLWVRPRADLVVGSSTTEGESAVGFEVDM